MSIDQMDIQVLDPDLELPRYAHAGDAGLDLRSSIDLILEPGQRAMVPTGIALALPAEHAGLVVPRSGLAAKYGISVVNAPGLIDANYRGEIKVILLNTDQRDAFSIKRGDRIAQLVIVPIATPQIVVVDSLDTTDRGADGFGSSGVQ